MASSTWTTLVFVLTIFASFYIAKSIPLMPSLLEILFDRTTTISTTGSTKLPTIEQGKYYMNFAGAAYCPDASNWTCEFCKRTGPNVKLVAEHQDVLIGSRALVTVDHYAQEIVVTWRGSDNLQNVVSDLVFIHFAYPYNNTIGVHSGVWGIFESLYNNVTSTLTTELTAHPSYSLVFTGHSIGGLLATFHVFAVKQDGHFIGTKMSLFSYAAPQGGNQAFADWYNDQDFVVGRFTANRDIVPHILPSWTEYVQINTEIWIQGYGQSANTTFCKPGIYEDPNCSAKNSPLYNPLDHGMYYDVDVTACGVAGLVQNFGDLVKLLPTVPGNPFNK